MTVVTTDGREVHAGETLSRGALFHIPYITGLELNHIQNSLQSGRLSGNGAYTQRCEQFFETEYGFHRALITTSCTDALEICGLLLDLQSGDEVIMPSYTFVSTANAFALRGARLIFADCEAGRPNIDVTTLEALITPKTRAIVAVHYAGMACDMQALVDLCHRHHLVLIEDAAHCVDAKLDGMPLGRFGQLATFSFHETKNISCGEGGMLVINDPAYVAQAEILREKGTDRSAFLRGEIDKYTWRAVGSSFLPADYVAAFLWGQLSALPEIQQKRMTLWAQYHAGLAVLEGHPCVQLSQLPARSQHNAHLYYLVCDSKSRRDALIETLRQAGYGSAFHYVPLHLSPYFQDKHDGRALPQTQRYADGLVRLPLYPSLAPEIVDDVVAQILSFFHDAT